MEICTLIETSEYKPHIGSKDIIVPNAAIGYGDSFLEPESLAKEHSMGVIGRVCRECPLFQGCSPEAAFIRERNGFIPAIKIHFPNP